MDSRHAAPISHILSVYAGSPGLVLALVTYVKSVEEQAKGRAEDELADLVCERLHDKPPHGLKCLMCYEAEKLVPMVLQVEAEAEENRRGKG